MAGTLSFSWGRYGGWYTTWRPICKRLCAGRVALTWINVELDDLMAAYADDHEALNHIEIGARMSYALDVVYWAERAARGDPALDADGNCRGCEITAGKVADGAADGCPVCLAFLEWYGSDNDEEYE